MHSVTSAHIRRLTQKHTTLTHVRKRLEHPPKWLRNILKLASSTWQQHLVYLSDCLYLKIVKYVHFFSVCCKTILFFFFGGVHHRFFSRQSSFVATVSDISTVIPILIFSPDSAIMTKLSTNQIARSGCDLIVNQSNTFTHKLTKWCTIWFINIPATSSLSIWLSTYVSNTFNTLLCVTKSSFSLSLAQSSIDFVLSNHHSSPRERQQHRDHYAYLLTRLCNNDLVISQSDR